MQLYLFLEPVFLEVNSVRGWQVRVKTLQVVQVRAYLLHKGGEGKRERRVIFYLVIFQKSLKKRQKLYFFFPGRDQQLRNGFRQGWPSLSRLQAQSRLVLLQQICCNLGCLGAALLLLQSFFDEGGGLGPLQFNLGLQFLVLF